MSNETEVDQASLIDHESGLDLQDGNEREDHVAFLAKLWKYRNDTEKLYDNGTLQIGNKLFDLWKLLNASSSSSSPSPVYYADPCDEFTLDFFMVLSLFSFVCLVIFSAYFLFRILRTRQNSVTALDILTGTVLVCSVFRCIPSIWQSLVGLGHELHHGQTVCKLGVYTIVGMAGVLNYLPLVYLAMAFKVIKEETHMVDTLARRNLAWFLLLVFAFEGAFGMIPAMFTDSLSRINRCIFDANTISQQLTILFSYAVIPYLSLPVLVIRVVKLRKIVAVQEVGDQKLRDLETVASIVSFKACVMALQFIMEIVKFCVLIWHSSPHRHIGCWTEDTLLCLDAIAALFIGILVYIRDRELSKDINPAFLWMNKDNTFEELTTDMETEAVSN